MRATVTGQALDRRDDFEYLLQRMPHVATAIAGFAERELRTSAFKLLVGILDLADVPDSTLRAEFRHAETVNEQLTGELGKLGAFLVTRYPGAYPTTGTVVDSAIHLLKEGWGKPATPAADRVAGRPAHADRQAPDPKKAPPGMGCV